MLHAYTEWKNLSIRIKSLLQTCERLFGALQINNQNSYGASDEIVKDAKKIFSCIQLFKSNYEVILPDNVKNCLEEFIRDKNGRFTPIQPDQRKKNSLEEIKILLVILSNFESEISYYFSDTQSYIRKTVEIAFAHLQRSLVVDKSLNLSNPWKEQKKNKKGEFVNLIEPDYEKLGAAHLLLHKIWAFKSHADGERTDLILSEPENPIFIDKNDPLYKSIDGLVLTEWKVATPKTYQTKLKEAKDQAVRYKFSSLYPLELSKYCYLILVSEKRIKAIKADEQFTEDDIIYRVINVAYNPDLPSQESREK